MNIVGFGNDQRVDFEQAHIFGDKCIIQIFEQCHALRAGSAVQLQRISKLCRIAVGASGAGCDANRMDQFWRIMRHGFDIHAALGRGDK